jgi:hypothetical protein
MNQFKLQLQIPGAFIEAKGDKEIALWESMWESNRFYSCLLCCDEQSYLRTPDGRFIFHKGRKENLSDLGSGAKA